MKADAERRPESPGTVDQSEYLAALRSYLGGGGETALERAYDIGRAALASGVGLLDLARTHHTALDALLPRNPAQEEGTRTLTAAAEFFCECASSYEMTYRGFHEANLALRHFNDVLEAEAGRIAHALHAEAGQLLVAVYIALKRLTEQVPPAARSHIAQITQLLDQIEEQLRRLAHELRPMILDDLGLVPALRYLSEGVAQRTQLKISIEGPEEERLPPAVEVVLYRVTKESLNNITRHAQASAAWIRIERDAHLIRCSIRDDGVGFDVRAVATRAGEQGFGLMGIRERLSVIGGSLQINSATGQGTELVISIPAEN